jgi:hypothetical protein
MNRLTCTLARPYSGFAGQRSDPLLDVTSSIDVPGVALVVRFAAVHQRDCVDETQRILMARTWEGISVDCLVQPPSF